MFASVPASTVKPSSALVERRDLVDPRLQRLGRDVVAEPVRGRVVGDREVLVAARLRRLDHLLERVAAVGERRVAVQVAAQVAERRSASAASPFGAASSSPRPSRSSGGIHGSPSRS